MNDIEILKKLENMQQTFIEEGLQGYEMVIVNTKNLINNLIARNKELEEENWIMRTVDKQYINKNKVKEILEKYSPNHTNTFIESQENYIKLTTELQELLEERN